MANFKETSMAAVFQNQAERLGDKACVAYKKDGVYVDISWNEMNIMIHDLAYYLLSLGVKKGDKIALFSHNRYEWWIADQAILSIGAVNVPIYATNSSEEASYIIKNSDSRICFVGNVEHLNKVLAVKRNLPRLKTIIIFDDYSKTKKGLISLPKAFKTGQSFKKKFLFEKRLKDIKLADLATIIYTSGTTGNPKGVMLTHNNFITNVKYTLEDMKGLYTEDDICLSFLPLSHSLERTAGYYGAVTVGSKTAFAEDVSTLLDNFQEVHPTIIISVPRIYEKVHSTILSNVADYSSIKKMLFNFAMNTAKKNLPYVCNNKPRRGIFAKRFALADKLIFSRIKAMLGMDRLKFAISGGGPLSVSDAEFFIGMGIIILEGFGLTETTPITHYNRPGRVKLGTVGETISKTMVKISNEGEVLIKGPQVMKGYYKNSKATKEAFTKDNFFRTGDIGMIDKDGFLSITGRIKDIIVTSGGKNISPQNIENSLKTSMYIEQIAVIGDRRKYLSALIVPAFGEIQKWAMQNNIAFRSDKDLIKKEEIIKLFESEIDENMNQYARVEQIRQFRILDSEWTQETGEMTPTSKVKRKEIEKKYAEEIEGMYQAG